ncbi:MAG: beta-lactamase family protein [Acidobacteria bacterium]|nr:beta-lactamase family protein [Acidobacteriota bacterium]
MDQAFAQLIKQHGINTACIGVIKAGQLVWQGQYGQQNETESASANTLINVASITKTVTAETVLRLVAQGKLDLDEPMAKYWVDPDLEGDAQVKQLTARMALSHRSGLPNWRFFTESGKLQFMNAPGSSFGYSGEGIVYVMRYAEKKLGKPFEDLVNEMVFEPLAIHNSFMRVIPENFPRIAKPLDDDGKFYGYYCYPGGYCREAGSFSATGDMVTTVSDYATFLVSAMRGDGLTESLKAERFKMNAVEVPKEQINCAGVANARCPQRLGYGLGWCISVLDNDLLIGHRGTDWSTVSLAYCYQNSGDGLIIFLNAPNRKGLAGMVAALELLDPDSPELHGYIMRRDRQN